MFVSYLGYNHSQLAQSTRVPEQRISDSASDVFVKLSLVHVLQFALVGLNLPHKSSTHLFPCWASLIRSVTTSFDRFSRPALTYVIKPPFPARSCHQLNVPPLFLSSVIGLRLALRYVLSTNNRNTIDIWVYGIYCFQYINCVAHNRSRSVSRISDHFSLCVKYVVSIMVQYEWLSFSTITGTPAQKPPPGYAYGPEHCCR